MGDLTFYQWANALKGYMLALGVAFGIVMIVLWWRASRAALRRDNEAKARGILAAYLLRSVELGEIARPPPAAEARAVRDTRYSTFVCYLVTVADQILILCLTASWEERLRPHLAPHRALLASAEFRATIGSGLTPGLRRLIDEVSQVDTTTGVPRAWAAE